MNITFRLSVFVAALLMIVTSCKKDDDSSSVYYAIQGGKLSGTINGIFSGDIDYIQAYISTIDDYVVGADSVNSANFSMDLVDPPAAFLEIFTADSGIVLSDTTVKGCMLFIICYKNGSFTGSLERSNSINIYTADTFSQGDVFCSFFYFDKSLTLSGQITGQLDSGVMVTNFDARFKPGWNELIYKCTSAGNGTYTFSAFANNEPEGLKWYMVNLFVIEKQRQQIRFFPGLQHVKSFINRGVFQNPVPVACSSQNHIE